MGPGSLLVGAAEVTRTPSLLLGNLGCLRYKGHVSEIWEILAQRDVSPDDSDSRLQAATLEIVITAPSLAQLPFPCPVSFWVTASWLCLCLVVLALVSPSPVLPVFFCALFITLCLHPSFDILSHSVPESFVR